MGNRANVYIINQLPDKGVYLYSHWGGDSLIETVRDALASGPGRHRWNDYSYLTRIIFCKMVGDNIDGELNYGISAVLCDNEHPIIVLNCEEQKIGLAKEPRKYNHAQPMPNTWISFDSFINETAKLAPPDSINFL